jgi:hypothetical protein
MESNQEIIDNLYFVYKLTNDPKCIDIPIDFPKRFTEDEMFSFIKLLGIAGMVARRISKAKHFTNTLYQFNDKFNFQYRVQNSKSLVSFLSDNNTADLDDNYLTVSDSLVEYFFKGKV